MERSKSALNITVIGGGLVGSTCACFMAKRGHNVHLYEYREDIRTMEHVQGRSINLAMSARARAALEVIGLEDHMINEHGIPMKARMIHGLDGSQTPIPYDKRTNQCIYSVGRKYLNEVLLTAAESYPNLKLNFNHKLVSANLKEGRVTIMQTKTQKTFEVTSDLIIGADGAFSAVRKHMMKQPLFDYSQTYIEHGYLELCIPPINNNFAMKHNYLHIWPRGEFMMIALPNQDRSWTVTLFMPFTKFQLLDTPENLIAFFEKYFPDSLPLIGEKKLIDDFFRGTPSPLVSIKCHPYDVGGKAIIIGDAAHAMVPFYGQGMNAGFEDCFLLDQLMEMHNEKLSIVLPAFTKRRTKDAHAICDLAMYNYVEMRDLVNRRGYKLRKMFDDFLFKVMPEKWVPLYNSVTFTNMGYEQCVKNRAWQDNIIMKTAWLVFSLFVMAFALIFFNFKNEPGFPKEPLSNPRFIHLPEHTHYHI